jgi:hypothetical protein
MHRCFDVIDHRTLLVSDIDPRARLVDGRNGPPNG